MQYSKFMANIYRYEENLQKEIFGVSKYENIGKNIKIGIKLCFPKRETGKIKAYLILKNKKKQYLSFLFEGKMNQRIFSVQKIIQEAELEENNIKSSDIIGVYILFNDEKYFVALWENENIDFFALKLSNDDLVNTTYRQKEENLSEISKQEICEADADNLENPEIREEVKEENKEENKEEVKEEIRDEIIDKLSDYKVTLLELRQLPKNYRTLANNNFLLHGYYNYHYIYLKSFENQYLVGVPGVFYPEEQKVAKIFGFDLFYTDSEILQLNDSCKCAHTDDNKKLFTESDYEKGTFGYWCISVDISE